MGGECVCVGVGAGRAGGPPPFLCNCPPWRAAFFFFSQWAAPRARPSARLPPLPHTAPVPAVTPITPRPLTSAVMSRASSWAQVAPVMARAVSLVTFLAIGEHAPLRRVAMWARQAGLPGTGGLGRGGRAAAVEARAARAARARPGTERIVGWREGGEREEREKSERARDKTHRPFLWLGACQRGGEGALGTAPNHFDAHLLARTPLDGASPMPSDAGRVVGSGAGALFFVSETRSALSGEMRPAAPSPRGAWGEVPTCRHRLVG